MELTELNRAKITDAMRLKNLNKSELASAMGYDKPWATKLLNGTRKRLDFAEVEKLEKTLGIKFQRMVETDPIPELARQLGKRLNGNADLQEITAALVRMSEKSLYHSLPYLPTKDLVAFGEEIMRAAHEDPEKPGKVGRIAVVWLTTRLKQLEQSGSKESATSKAAGK